MGQTTDHTHRYRYDISEFSFESGFHLSLSKKTADVVQTPVQVFPFEGQLSQTE